MRFEHIRELSARRAVRLHQQGETIKRPVRRKWLTVFLRLFFPSVQFEGDGFVKVALYRLAILSRKALRTNVSTPALTIHAES